jgi:pyruvate formate lyase activating enzyme
MVELVLRHGCESIAFTYSEPTVFGEYAMDTAILAKKAGLATVLVSNAFITLEAAKDIYPLMDAANIDIKGFTEEFYHTQCARPLSRMSLSPPNTTRMSCTDTLS